MWKSDQARGRQTLLAAPADRHGAVVTRQDKITLPQGFHGRAPVRCCDLGARGKADDSRMRARGSNLFRFGHLRPVEPYDPQCVARGRGTAMEHKQQVLCLKQRAVIAGVPIGQEHAPCQ